MKKHFVIKVFSLANLAKEIKKSVKLRADFDVDIYTFDFKHFLLKTL